HDRWRSLLHGLGSCEVKHGARIDISNLYSDELGNQQPPKKFQALKKHHARCVGRQWRSGCWWWPRSPLWFSLFCAKDRLVRSPLPWKKASRFFRSKTEVKTKPMLTSPTVCRTKF